MNIKTCLKYQYLVILPLSFYIDFACSWGVVDLKDLALYEVTKYVKSTRYIIDNLPIPKSAKKQIENSIALDASINGNLYDRIHDAHFHFHPRKFSQEELPTGHDYEQLPSHPYLPPIEGKSINNKTCNDPIIKQSGHFYSYDDNPAPKAAFFSVRSVFFALIGSSEESPAKYLVISHDDFDSTPPEQWGMTSIHVYNHDEINKINWSKLEFSIPIPNGKEEIQPSLLTVYRIIKGLTIPKAIADEINYTGTIAMKIEDAELVPLNAIPIPQRR